MKKPVTRGLALWQFILTMVAVGVIAWLLQGAQRKQDDAIEQVRVNTNTICESRKTTLIRFNGLVDELETSVRQGSTLPPQEQADRIKRYEALRIPMITCAT